MNDALFAHALRSHQAGNLAEAARLYSSVLRTEPRHFQALYLLGFVHFQQGQFEQAASLIGEAVKINPGMPDAFYNWGCALQNLQRREESVKAFDRAIALKPDYDEALVNRGAALLALKRYPEAIASFDAALRLKPRDAEAISNRATVLFEIKRYEDAAAGFASLKIAAPDFPFTRGNLALARAYCCDWRFYAEERIGIIADIRLGKPTISPHASTLLLSDAEAQLHCARRWVADRAPPVSLPLWRGERYRHDKIRVAYISADFQAHATAFLIAGVFEHHDRSRFETNLISFGHDDNSDMRARLVRGCDRFTDVLGKSDADVAAMLRQMEIDIAIDLKGFTQDARPGIFARRPAPVQVNYLAHPGTMGADYMDYIFADETVIPPAQQNCYNEKVVYLPDSYQANDARRRVADRVPTRAEAGLPETGFVFCCFNNSYKITPLVFDVWMRLLKASDGSVLWLLDDNPTATANLKREAQARGVPPNRLVFAPRIQVDDHLARHALADLFLDTLPCAAHTTASDALWAGLPVLTVLGSTFAGRVAASLLGAAEMPELIASTVGDYEAKALDLARNPDMCREWRTKLANNRAALPLFNTVRFTRHLEAALQGIWEISQRGEPPKGFSIAREE